MCVLCFICFVKLEKCLELIIKYEMFVLGQFIIYQLYNKKQNLIVN